MSKRRPPRGTLTLRRVVDALEAIAPVHLAAEWDNVGLLAGDPDAACRRALLTIDMTPAVLAEARRARTDLIIAYHPPIFRPVRSLRADSLETDSLVYAAVSHGRAVYALHTALDAARGGTNDTLAEMCDMTDIRTFEDAPTQMQASKVVVFVPQDDLPRVADAMFAAGAGRIGDYEQCSFAAAGTGTFFGTERTRPAVGKRGRRESVEEARFEVVCPNECLDDVVEALCAAHSYEAPAFDVYPLSAPPRSGVGMGRVGRLPAGTTLRALASRLKRRLKLPGVEVIGEPGQHVATAAVCAGSAGRLPLDTARARTADVIVTGELRHHDRLLFARANKAVVLLGHCNSERPVLPEVKARLQEAVRTLGVRIAAADCAPATIL